jgi:Na+-transporting NADH:ubiquinone oxidoreductase subunit A
MSHIKIKKGHDIKISGLPEANIALAPAASVLALLPSDFKGVKPKLMVKIGDNVKIGSPIFFDKLNPDVKWASPGSGVIKDIMALGEL